MVRRTESGKSRNGVDPLRRRVPTIADRAAHAFLRTCPLFSRAEPGDVGRLAAKARRLRLKPGEFLFREDEPSSAVFVVEEGVLEVIHEHPDTSERLHLGDMRRGALVGELGVMRGDVRAASVRALEPVTLISLSARDFVSFVRATPSAALYLAELLAERPHPLVRSNGASPHPQGEVWAVERTDDLDSAFAAALARAVWRRGSRRPPKVWCAAGAQTRLAKAHGLRFEALPEVLRPSAGEVEIVLGSYDGLQRLSREVSAFVSGLHAPGIPGVERSRHLRMTRSGPLSAQVMRFSSLRIHETADRVVRFLEGRTIGLALGGGGALGLCHLGVLEVLARERIPIDFLAGTSAGALVGGVSLVRGSEETRLRAESFTRRQLFSLVDLSFFMSGMMEGRRILRFFRDLVGRTHIQELPIAFAALALDLETGEERALTSGPLAEALRATVSLPSVFAPFSFEGDNRGFPRGTYIDAGGVTNVPVDVVRELGAHRTIGVNVINRPQEWARNSPRWNRWSPIGRGKMIAYAEMIGFARNGERQVFSADVPILPDTKDFGFTQFYRAKELADIGRRAALDVIPQLRALTKSARGGSEDNS